MSGLIVTIDGPGGTGKSTVSRELARRIGLPHLDTGAFYRAATLAVLRASADPYDPAAVFAIVGDIGLAQIDGSMFLDGEDVSREIRRDVITSAVSAVSAHPEVRRRLVEMQRDWVESHGGRGVVEGRDIGSVVFPDANLKIYLDARPDVRASRRSIQSGENESEVLGELTRRDHLDSTRTASPMSVPDDAVVIDTSDLVFDAVVDQIAGLVAGMS